MVAVRLSLIWFLVNLQLRPVCLCRFNVLLDRCYATTSPFPLNSTYYDLFVGWVHALEHPSGMWTHDVTYILRHSPERSQRSLGSHICLCILVCPNWQCLVTGATMTYRPSWALTETPKRPASPLRLSALCRMPTKRCRPTTCTVPPDCVSIPSALPWNR